jgi:hypothetical protein
MWRDFLLQVFHESFFPRPLGHLKFKKDVTVAVVDTGGKFAAIDTGGQLATGVFDTGEARWDANIFENCWKFP